MHDHRFRRFLHALMLCTASGFIVGCEYQPARDRTEVQSKLQEVEAMLASSMNDPATLKKAASTLKAIDKGTDEQQASRDLMLASVNMALAHVHMEKMEKVEVDVRHGLMYVNTLLNNARALKTFIDERNISPSSLGSDDLHQVRQDEDTRRQRLDRKIGDMKVPIAEMKQTNTEQSLRIRDLRRAAESLRQEQYELGPLDGFEVFERSIAADREANSIEKELTQRQVILNLESEPELNRTTQHRDHSQGQIDEIDKARGRLQDMASLQAQQAASARSLLEKTDVAINERMTSLTEQDNGPLMSEYLEAKSQLEAAASNAGKGSRKVNKDARNAATLMETRARLDLLRVETHRLRGLQERIAILDRLASSDMLTNRDNFSLQHAKALETLEQTKAAAIADSQAIIQALGNVRGGEVDGIRASVEQTMSGLTGQPAPSRPAPVETNQPTTPDTPPASSGPRFDTPQALIEYANSLNSKPISIEAQQQSMSELCYSTTGQAEKDMAEMLESTRVMEEFFEEASKKFPNDPNVLMFKKGMKQAESSALQVNMKMLLPTLKMTSDTTAEVGAGFGETRHLIKTAEGWKFDLDADYAALTPQDRIMAEEITNMLSKMAESMKRITKQLRDGEITTKEQFEAAMKKISLEMMQKP